jgi:hypothetical protein
MSLGISPLLFNHAFDRCYCGCKPLPNFIQEGGRRYVLPKPGTRFALCLDEARNDAIGCFNDWHTCFHGTTFAALAPVLECGYLLYPGSISVYGQEVKAREHRGDGTRLRNDSIPADTICVSPSVSYASHPVYAKPMPRGGQRYRVALQCKIRPDAYQTFGCTLRGLPESFDPYVPKAEMEWHTRRSAPARPPASQPAGQPATRRIAIAAARSRAHTRIPPEAWPHAHTGTGPWSCTASSSSTATRRDARTHAWRVQTVHRAPVRP